MRSCLAYHERMEGMPVDAARGTRWGEMPQRWLKATCPSGAQSVPHSTGTHLAQITTATSKTAAAAFHFARCMVP